MFVRPLDNPPESIDELLGPELSRALDRLDVLSRKVFAGKLPGERRSKRRGRSVEFDDYRAYVPGDDLRHIDWNVFARFDRFVIKLFKEDEDLAVRVLLDYYHQATLNSPATEASLFWRQRDDVTRASGRASAAAAASFEAHLPGVPGNYFLQPPKLASNGQHTM